MLDCCDLDDDGVIGARKLLNEELRANTMDRRKRRICSYCGFLTEEEYTDEEWEAMGHECEECYISELSDGTLDDD
jgi:hypothetical protein